MIHSQGSTPSSGYWSSQTSTRSNSSLNSQYLCYWLDSCNGRHEIDQCHYWEDDLKGKLGIYYSPSGTYKLFTRDGINRNNLESNPTGCTNVHLLVYNHEKREILFGLKWCKEKRNNSQSRSLQLTFPSAKPFQQDGNMLQVARRAFQWLTTDTEFTDQCLKQGLKQRFLFHNANVIYPVHLTNEQASKLTEEFVKNEEFQSLHWFPLSEVRQRIPPQPNYITQEETENELAQTQWFEPIRMKLGEYPVWYAAATCLMYIREHVAGRLEAFIIG